MKGESMNKCLCPLLTAGTQSYMVCEKKNVHGGLNQSKFAH